MNYYILAQFILQKELLLMLFHLENFENNVGLEKR